MAKRLAPALALLVGLVTVGIGPARAGGGRLAPVAESYEPGDAATLVGYTGGPTLPSVPTGPFYAYLRPAAEGGDLGVLDTDIGLGPLVLEETGHRGYLTLRVSITFDVPGDLEPGEYVVWYCDDPCTRAQIGDLIPSPLSIGVGPSRPVTRAWAFDDPEIANLAPDALVVGPDQQVTAAEVRAGLVSPPPEPSPTTVATQAPAPVTPTEESAPAATGAPPAPAEIDWTLPTVLVLAAATGTWLLLAHHERTWVRGAPTRLPAVRGGRRNAAAGQG